MDSKLDGLWVVVYAQGKSFLGKVVKAGMHVNHSVTPNAVLEADFITLCPAYDFFSPIRPVQQDGRVMYSRDPVVTPFDFAIDDLPVSTRVGAVAFFEDMSDDDRATYESFIKGADEMKAMQIKNRNAQKSGIILPEKGGIARPTRR